MGISYCIVGHSERREYFAETNAMLAEKINLCLENFITPIFCCGEPLAIREANTQNVFVAKQLQESLFHLSTEKLKNVVIAYEPIWAIGTGKTATTEQAQEMHAYLRSVLVEQYDGETANEVSILYGGSVKANNAKELFSCPDVDGGLVGGASLIAHFRQSALSERVRANDFHNSTQSLNPLGCAPFAGSDPGQLELLRTRPGRGIRTVADARSATSRRHRLGERDKGRNHYRN